MTIHIPPNLTKENESRLLREIAAAFGPYSYLGPWLDGVAGEVESDIRNDLPPAPNVAGSRLQAEAILREAQTGAERRIGEANREAAKLVEAARAESDRLRGQTRRQLQEALRAIPT